MDTNELLRAILQEGIPVALWFRRQSNCSMNPAEVKEKIETILSGEKLSELPKLVKSRRIEAEGKNDIGNHLTLLWDDFNRKPPLKSLQKPRQKDKN